MTYKSKYEADSENKDDMVVRVYLSFAFTIIYQLQSVKVKNIHVAYQIENLSISCII